VIFFKISEQLSVVSVVLDVDCTYKPLRVAVDLGVIDRTNVALITVTGTVVTLH